MGDALRNAPTDTWANDKPLNKKQLNKKGDFKF